MSFAIGRLHANRLSSNIANPGYRRPFGPLCARRLAFAGARLGRPLPEQPGDQVRTRVRVQRWSHTLHGMSLLLHRLGFSPQVPKHRPVERDEEAIVAWRWEM